MFDPEAARITDGRRLGANIETMESPRKKRAVVTYTLKVNGKNRFGAYTGNKLYECITDIGETRILSVAEFGPWLQP